MAGSMLWLERWPRANRKEIKSAENFIRNAGYEKDVQCNERIMLSVVLDYLADIERLKELHGIEHVRNEKGEKLLF